MGVGLLKTIRDPLAQSASDEKRISDHTFAVEPAATLPYEALRHGAVVVEINPDETPLTPRATFVLRGPAGEILPELVRRWYLPNNPGQLPEPSCHCVLWTG